LNGRGHKQSGGSAAPDAVHVQFAYSSNLDEMMAALIPAFNAAGIKANGHPVFVDGLAASSGDVQTKIIRGQLQPAAWSPASSLWGRLLNQAADRKYVADTNPSLAASPVVIAMWEPLARAIGWPSKAIGFADILRLATTDSHWSKYGKPTFGTFKLGHTNPDFSTSGLSFVAAQYYTAAGKREGLTLADVQRPAIRKKVRAIEQSIVHYGDKGSFFADQLAAHGPAYASAVAMEETTLIEFNQKRPPGSMKLVAIYPVEGTFMTDNPYLVLNAPWVTPQVRQAAEAFGAWLQRKLTPSFVARYRYRSGAAGAKPVAPVTPANGADPSQPRRLLTLPDPTVLARIKAAWHEDRKPANVLLVVDVSGSMSDEDKIGHARQGLRRFLHEFSPRDRVGLTSFDSTAHPLVPIARMSLNGPALRNSVDQLVALGSTALYDAASAGWQAVDALRDDTRINAVVVLSDGADTASHRQLEDVLGPLRARGNGEGRQVRVFTIAYGSDANGDILDKIAAASGGQSYSGDPKTIEKVYLQISSFF
ncbi:MAG: Ca-activated chloride channel, partial [Frankiaceae bacterium]|nr:Ca-activated chloride channel [Frankiaceae bacterium]